MLDFIAHGVTNESWFGYLIYTIIVTQLTSLAVTLYLHRAQAHRSLELHPILSHFFRFWLWMTTGMVTREWVAIHRKHHAFSDKPGDPHSPQVYGLKRVFFAGSELYRDEAKNQETLVKYGSGSPDDWIEERMYSGRSRLGVSLMLGINLILFGPIGLSIWAIQMMWIPISAAGVINGIAHAVGYRNFPSQDSSTNILPFGLFCGGEELHNNHHTFATSAKFSYHWYEFDIGWMWIRLFEIMKLAKARRVIPVLSVAKTPKTIVDLQTLNAIISNRYGLMSRYAKIFKVDCRNELAKLQHSLHDKISWNRLKLMLTKDSDTLTKEELVLLQKIAAKSSVLHKIINMRAELAKLWQRSNLTQDELLHALQNWCHQAEASGIQALQTFSLRLRASY